MNDNLVGHQPLIRWAGGKRLFLRHLAQCVHANHGRYFEPMVGSGALFFCLSPENAVLGDINCDLINFYRILKRQPRKLHDAICQLSADKDSYYSLRSQIPGSRLGQAARFFFLIRLSWNGLYRVNKNGQFNVPFGGRTPRELISLDRLLAASVALRKAQLFSGDFEDTTRSATSGDFVYFDPPYPKGAANGNGFARYNETGFTLSDHKRLAEHAARLADRGVHVLITEAARTEILQHYSSAFSITRVRTRSLIAADSRHRRYAYEAILTSYKARRDPLGCKRDAINTHLDEVS